MNRQLGVIKNINIVIPYTGGHIAYFEYAGEVYQVLGISAYTDLIPQAVSPLWVPRQYIVRNSNNKTFDIYTYIKTCFNGATYFEIDSIREN